MFCKHPPLLLRNTESIMFTRWVQPEINSVINRLREGKNNFRLDFKLYNDAFMSNFSPSYNLYM